MMKNKYNFTECFQYDMIIGMDYVGVFLNNYITIYA